MNDKNVILDSLLVAWAEEAALTDREAFHIRGRALSSTGRFGAHWWKDRLRLPSAYDIRLLLPNLSDRHPTVA